MSCVHLREAGSADPGGPAGPAGTAEDVRICAECTELGWTDWVHLRRCLTCGHVACCDSSPHRHASGHHERTGHPVMQSHEPGESWRWCFVDERIG